MEHYTLRKIDGKEVEMYTISKEELEKMWEEATEKQANDYEEYERRNKILEEYGPKDKGIIENPDNMTFED